MPVVGVLVDLGVGPRVGIDRVRADEVRAGDHVPEVAVDRVDEEQLAERVPVVAPGVGRAVGEDLEALAARVIAPEAAADGHAERFGRAGRADLARRRRPAAAIEPAVGAPVAGRWRRCDSSRLATEKPSSTTSAGPSGTSSPSRSGRNSNRGGQSSQTPPKPSSTLASICTSSVKTVAPVEPAVAVGVFEDQDAVAEPEVELLGLLGVGVVLGDPEPPAAVPGHGDRVLDVGLGGEDRDVESLGDPKALAASAAGIGPVEAGSEFLGAGKS